MPRAAPPSAADIPAGPAPTTTTPHSRIPTPNNANAYRLDQRRFLASSLSPPGVRRCRFRTSVLGRSQARKRPRSSSELLGWIAALMRHVDVTEVAQHTGGQRGL